MRGCRCGFFRGFESRRSRKGLQIGVFVAWPGGYECQLRSRADPRGCQTRVGVAGTAICRRNAIFGHPTRIEGGASRLYMPTYTDRDGHRRTTVGWEYVHIALDDESVSFTHRRLGRLAASLEA